MPTGMIRPKDQRHIVGDIVSIREVGVKLEELKTIKLTKPGIKLTNPRHVAGIGRFTDIE